MGRQGKRAVFDPDVIARARLVVDRVSYGDQTLAAVSLSRSYRGVSITALQKWYASCAGKYVMTLV